MQDDADDGEADIAAALLGIELREKPPKPTGFMVWAENWPTVEAWMALQTQWHRTGMDGSRTGLIYQAIPTVLELLDITDRRDTFHRLQAMEYAALDALAEQAKKAPPVT